MRTLPLYNEPPNSLISGERPRDHDAGCTRCPRHEGARNVCLKPEGAPGGVLIVGEFPGQGDDQSGHPFSGEIGALVRKLVGEIAPAEPVTYTYGVLCPGKRDTALKAAGECRRYLAAAIRDAKPTRIVALGPVAALALTGRSLASGSVHKAYTWTRVGAGTVPVFLLPDPLGAARNRFLRRAFSQALRWALTEQLALTQGVWNGVTHCVTTAEESALAMAHVEAAGGMTLDAEWAGKVFNRSFRLLSFAVTPYGTTDSYTWDSGALYDPAVCAPLLKALRDRRVKKCGHGIKADLLAVYSGIGVWARGVEWDTLLTGKMLDGEISGYLEDMAERVGMGGHKAALEESRQEGLARFRKYLKEKASGQGGLFGKRCGGIRLADESPISEYPDLTPALAKELEAEVERKNGDHKAFSFAVTNADVLRVYNARDTVATALLARELRAEVGTQVPLARAWERLVCPAVSAVAQVEAWGVAADRQAAQALSDYLALQQAEVRQRFVGYGYDPLNPKGGAFNPDSNADVGSLLYEKLKLPRMGRTDSGQASVDADTLEELYKKKAHPILKDLIRDRELGKQKSTYADAILRYIRDDGRIHGNINLSGARTGRLSIDSPSLQNIPRASSELGKLIRNCFVVPEGKLLLELDYSQAELRIAAGLSGDPVMLAMFASGEDFHLRTAQLISQIAWGIPPEAVTDAHRQTAKTINFALLFGKDEYGLSFELGCTVQQAKRVKDAILGRFHVLARWIQDQVTYARTHGGVWTWWDGGPCRWRPLYNIAEPNGFNDDARRTAERGAYNTQVQGTANEFCLAALTDLTDWIRADGVPAKLVLTIHDALYFEVEEHALAEVYREASRIMCGYRTPSNVPLVVDAKVGTRLGDMQKRKFAHA